MDFSEKWGTDVEEAVKLALIDLKLTREEVTVTILEEPSKGFFGIGSKLAKVRVEKKQAEPGGQKAEPAKPKPEPARQKTEPKERKAEPARQKARPSEPEPELEPEPVYASVIEEPEENFVPVDQHAALDFLKETTEKMGLDLDIQVKVSETCVYADIQGKDSGTVIGKRGQTLDAIQYLTSLVVNKDKEKYFRVVVDVENYRAKREKTLEQLANRLAEKVVRTKRSVRLEPMNPYERKVIHATLQKNPKVTTKSEGQEPYRRVIIEMK